MSENLKKIYFYIPRINWPTGNLLEGPDAYQKVIKNCVSTGTYSWILQTYLHLKASGFPCELVGDIPEEGIVLAYRKTIPDDLQPGANLLIVCVQGDEGQHPYAQVHVVQNPQEVIMPYRVIGDRYLFPGEIYYIPHWPQPGLIGRDAARGDKFENVAYLGREMNLAPELLKPSWEEQLWELGLKWHLVSSRDRWNDYREVDVVLAVRNFGSSRGYTWKPAAKLYNAWHAGVPAILGRDSAYREERKSELDYLEVTTLKDAIAALKRLRDDKELRHAMIENGRVRAEETKAEKLLERWRSFLTNVAVPAYEHWCTGSYLTRQAFLMRRTMAIKTKDFRSQIRRLKGQITGPLKSLVSKSRTSSSKP